MDEEMFQRWGGPANEDSDDHEPPMDQPTERQVSVTKTAARSSRQTSRHAPAAASGSSGRRLSTRRQRPSRKKRESMQGYWSDNTVDDGQPQSNMGTLCDNAPVSIGARKPSEVINDNLTVPPKDNPQASHTGSTIPQATTAPLRWEKAPPTGTMSLHALQFAFLQHRLSQKHDTDETDALNSNNEQHQDDENDQPTSPFHPHAFGPGPRTTPPFRPLHLIHSPKSADLTGWAENLRWAREQYLTFGESGWTECPEHMERIVEMRQGQLWASGELIVSIQDEQEEEAEEEAWMDAMLMGAIEEMGAEYEEPGLLPEGWEAYL